MINTCYYVGRVIIIITWIAIHYVTALPMPPIQLKETEEKADQLSVKVAEIIQQHCSCNFPDEFISNPTLQCPAANPDSSNKVLFRAQVQMGGANRLSYSDVIVHLEEARDRTGDIDTSSFSFKVRP